MLESVPSGAVDADRVALPFGHSGLTVMHRRFRGYRSEEAVRAHAELSPVNRLEW